MQTKDKSPIWIEYWNNDNTFAEMMKSIAPHFIEATKPILQYNPRDVVLDIGCGPGNLEYYLKDMVREVHAVDTSEKYIEECRKRFDGEENLFFYKLDADDYTDLSFLRDRGITTIICLSVVQYYNDVKEVESLIRSVRDIASRDALMLIADLPVEHGALADICSNLRISFRKRILFQTIEFMFQMRFSSYHHARSSRGLLRFSEDSLKQLIEDGGIDAKILKDPLTFNRSRLHFLIKL
jgi:SAM-dependent methyltransferase